MNQQTHFGIPRLSVRAADNSEIDLSIFYGHALLVIFCPPEDCDPMPWLKELSAHADDLTALGAWAIVITDKTLPMASDLRLLLASDPDDDLRAALEEHLRHDHDDLAEGGVFLFCRGGSLQRHWRGQPPVDEVMRELGGK